MFETFRSNEINRMLIMCGVFILLLILPFHNSAQSINSNVEALRVLTNALQTLGGEAKLKSFKSIYVSAKGVEHRSADAQGYHPEKETTARHEEKLAVFFDEMRLAYEFHTGRHDGTMRWRRIIFTAERNIFADFMTKSASASPVAFPSLERTQAARRIPHILLLEASTNRTSLNYLGIRSFNNREHEVISVNFPNAKAPILLYLDKKTNLLSKYEFSVDFPSLGKSLAKYTFSNYRRHQNLGWFPTKHSIKLNGKIWRTMHYDEVLADSNEAEVMLGVPPELEGFITPAGTVKEIAKGVYLVYRLGGYQPMFIEFKDFIMAIEAPASVQSLDDTPVESLAIPDALSNELIVKIKQAIPNKPIKYVVPTHYHSDHAGGIRAFTRENAIVLTTVGNKKFYENFAPNIIVETFDKKRVISDGERTVELIDVGANPHTEENIVVYLPHEKYLYQGDLFYFGGEATFPIRDRLTVMPFFANWLMKNNLAPERIYGFHSVSFGTMDHINMILKLNIKSQNNPAL